MTIAILFLLARVHLSLRLLGGLSYSLIVLGGFISGLSGSIAGYVLGFLLVIGFDKMFNVYMRSIRQRVIPAQDFGKTVGVITLLNNLSQPLAGLLVGGLAAPLGARGVVLVLSVASLLIGVAACWRWHERLQAT